jgi:hypothetical protein
VANWRGLGVRAGDMSPHPHAARRPGDARPQWNCRTCAAEWPCDARRRELTAEFAASPTRLSLYLSNVYHHMCADDIPTDVAYRRTLSSIRSPIGARPAIGTFPTNSQGTSDFR